MANRAGMQTSLINSTNWDTALDFIPRKRSVEDLINIITPTDIPLLRYLGFTDSGAARSKFRIGELNTKYSWLYDDLTATVTSLTGADLASVSAASVSQTTTVVASNVVREGHILKIQTGTTIDYALVTAISGTTLSILRKYWSTGDTASFASSGSVVTVVSNARDEGEESDPDYTTTPTEEFNFTQIFQAEMLVSGSVQKVPMYGIKDLYNWDLKKKMKEQAILLDRTLYLGTRNAGTATTPRTMGGLPQFIGTATATYNVRNLSGGALTQKDLEDVTAQAWTAGGMPSLIVCGAWAKRKISSFFAAQVRTTRTERTGGMRIDNVETEFGTLDILVDRWCPPDQIWVLSPEYIGIIAFRPFFDEPLAKTGDYVRGQLIGEYGFMLKNPGAHARIDGISTTS